MDAKQGAGNHIGNLCALIRALDMDHRAKEAHEFWLKKIGRDLHSVPWKLCNSMISIYYRKKLAGESYKGLVCSM